MIVMLYKTVTKLMVFMGKVHTEHVCVCVGGGGGLRRRKRDNKERKMATD